MTRLLTGAILTACLALTGAIAAEENAKPAKPEKTKLTTCEMTFSLKGWSALYKTAKGEGTITCDNGESAAVIISAKGGGLTVGKSEIIDGSGKFSAVRGIEELFGAYAQAEAHAGAVKSSRAAAMTKGEVSLALAGTGSGFDLGVAFGKFTITRQEEEPAGR